MSFNLSNLAASSASTGNSPISALYPPTKLEGDTVTITGFLEGVGIESFTYDERGYAQLTVYKEIEGTESKRTYSANIYDFFTSEARRNLNGKFLLDTFLVFKPNADLTKAGNIENMEDLVTEFNKVFTLPTPMNPEVHAKIVLREAEGEKAKYNLSRNFPVVEPISKGKMKFKTDSKDPKYNDLTVFHKVAPQTDGELGNSAGFDLATPTFDDSIPNL